MPAKRGEPVVMGLTLNMDLKKVRFLRVFVCVCIRIHICSMYVNLRIHSCMYTHACMYVCMVLCSTLNMDFMITF